MITLTIYTSRPFYSCHIYLLCVFYDPYSTLYWPRVGSDDESDEESEDDSDWSESEEESESEEGGYDLDACPSGCDQTLYDNTCTLREKRLDIEEALAEEKKNR